MKSFPAAIQAQVAADQLRQQAAASIGLGARGSIFLILDFCFYFHPLY